MTSSEPPIAGTVLRYAYLWHYQKTDGRERGEKDRPVALLLSKRPDEGSCVVLPITHVPPDDPLLGIEIPGDEKARLGLDQNRSWIILSELNHFIWPGPDLRAVPGKVPETVIYGRLSKSLYRTVLERVQTLIRAGMTRPVPRSE